MGTVRHESTFTVWSSFRGQVLARLETCLYAYHVWTFWLKGQGVAAGNFVSTVSLDRTSNFLIVPFNRNCLNISFVSHPHVIQDLIPIIWTKEEKEIAISFFLITFLWDFCLPCKLTHDFIKIIEELANINRCYFNRFISNSLHIDCR